MKKIYVKIDGIHCNHCIDKITKSLLKIKNIKDVSIKNNIATISYTGKLDTNLIIKTITDLDYITNNDYISDDIKNLDAKIKLNEFIIIFIVLILIAWIINKIFGFNIFSMIPTIDSNITYGMLFITGLLTSIHCISMCGAINLIASTGKNKNLKKPLLYNLGRVISYTIIGGIAGLFGGVLSVNTYIEGTTIIIASIFMLLMSLKMLGIIDYKIPSFKHLKVKTNNSFLIGLLNGLMPCGPLQAMQLYALSTGSLFKGALSMFLFALGTVPLMFLIGLFINVFKGKKKILINKVASILILILSLVMLNRGLVSFNINLFNNINTNGYVIATLEDGYQVIEIDLDYNNYEDIIVLNNVPVKFIINVEESKLTGCNNEIVISEYDIKQKLSVGENILEFTPTKTGNYIYSCWMNMITNNIKVVDDESIFKED